MMDCLDSLRQDRIFETVPTEQLTWLVDQSECIDYPPDTIIYSPNDPTDHLFIILKGRILLYLLQAGQKQEVNTSESGSITGVLPFSRMKTSVSYWQTLEPTTVLTLHRDRFRELTMSHYELTEVLVQQMTARVREFTKMRQQNDKMISLGRLSAGLAHELNNPVAAIVRSVDTLKDHLHATPEQFKGIMALKLTDDQTDAISAVLFNRVQNQQSKKSLTLLEQACTEDDLTDWLDDHAIDKAAELSETLTEFGFTTDDLEALEKQTNEGGLAAVLGWLVNNLITENLVTEITEASQRIATLIGAIKSYTHMDRGIGQDCVFLAEGLNSTLTLLKHKIKAKNISVKVTIPEDLPQIQAWPSELNQLWTNLIDNAIDAMSEGGTLQVSAEVDREFILTRIIDDGAGIPAEIMDQIFDPFFTTKAIGKGTGLGLDIVQGIIHHHHGQIYVNSEAGRTEFKVCLPIESKTSL
ncbi:ATP-binding protein [Tellurirhabdus bombi]|uniref:ATP-binding protein n=1 Tax=Tellurirhabdus bombi TaxID=2907205 RepID=UPI00286E81C4|nr:ATP-binding protein [Tellurirhabdus bombi]